MFLIIIAFVLHLVINQISFLLGNLYLSFFCLIGKIIHAVILHTEYVYDKHPHLKEKTILKFLLLKKDNMFYSASEKLLKSQLHNLNNKKHYSFFQKLKAVLLYLVFMPDKYQLQQFFSHKFNTVKSYINKIKNHGLFAIIPKEQYKRIPHNIKPIEVVRKVWEIYDANPTFGRFKIALIMFLNGYVISPSTVRNYLKCPRPPILKKRRYKKHNKTFNKKGNKKIKTKYPNHTWSADFTSVKLIFIYVYVFFVIDIYSRKIIYFDVSYHQPTSLWTIQRMKNACMEIYGNPKHLITDNGGQFKSKEFKRFCKTYNIKHRRGKPYSPRSNAQIERFNETIKHEALNFLFLFSTKQLRKMVDEFIDYYNNYRPHQGIYGITPNMKYLGIEKPPDFINPIRKTKTFCKGLITAFYTEEKAA